MEPLFIIISILVLIFFLNFKAKYKCNDCKAKFRNPVNRLVSYDCYDDTCPYCGSTNIEELSK